MHGINHINALSRRIFRYRKLPCTVYSIRAYANPAHDDINRDGSSSELDKDLLNIIHSYPKDKNASPYEILNISSKSNLKNSELKKIFFQLAKIYHPDSSSAHGYPLNKDKFFDSNDVLTHKIKDERFKKILSAYNLLKNPIAKSNYDRYNIGWNDGSNLRTNPNMYNPSSPEYRNYRNSSYTNRTHFTSYETGTWEDRYKYGHETAYGFHSDKSWSSSQTGDFKEELMKNKKTIFLSIFLTISIYSALQLSHLYMYDGLIGEKYNESTTTSIRMHEKSEGDLFHAYTNYGLGDSKEDRINRFLWWRKLTMSFSLADVREVLDNFYKRGVIDLSEEEKKLKQYEYHVKKE